MISGLLVATPRQPVLAAVTAVEKAGLKVARVDLSTFASLRSIADERLAVEAVLDLGAQLTSIVIHNQGIPKVVRTVPRGGRDLTDALADKLGLSHADAESIKREVGLTGSNREVVKVLTEVLRPLLAEIRSSIHYFASSGGDAPLERISLTGGGASLPGLSSLLGEQMGIPAGVVAPLQHIRNRWVSQQDDEGARVPGKRRVGRSGDGGSGMTTISSPTQVWNTMPGWGIVADLTPPELIASRRLAVIRKALLSGLIFLTVLLLCGYGYAYRTKHVASSRWPPSRRAPAGCWSSRTSTAQSPNCTAR